MAELNIQSLLSIGYRTNYFKTIHLYAQWAETIDGIAKWTCYERNRLSPH